MAGALSAHSSSTSAAAGGISPFLRLPFELRFHVAMECEQPDRCCLALTCRALRPAASAALWQSPELGMYHTHRYSHCATFRDAFGAATAMAAPTPTQLLIGQDGPQWWDWLCSGSPAALACTAHLKSLWLMAYTSYDFGEIIRRLPVLVPQLRGLQLDLVTESPGGWDGIRLDGLTSLVLIEFHACKRSTSSLPQFFGIASGLVYLNLCWMPEDGDVGAPADVYDAIAGLLSLRVLTLNATFDAAAPSARFSAALARLESASLYLWPAYCMPSAPRMPTDRELGWCGPVGLFCQRYPRLAKLQLTLHSSLDAKVVRDALGRTWPDGAFPCLERFSIHWSLLPEDFVRAGAAAVIAASLEAGFKITEHTAWCVAGQRKSAA